MECKKTIILVSKEGIDIGKALSFAPPDLSHIGKEQAIQAIISDACHRKIAVKKICEAFVQMPRQTAMPLKKNPLELVDAADRGNDKLVMRLLAAGDMNLEEKNELGNTAVKKRRAARQGYHSIVQALLKSGANKDAANNVRREGCEVLLHDLIW